MKKLFFSLLCVLLFSNIAQADMQCNNKSLTDSAVNLAKKNARKGSPLAISDEFELKFITHLSNQGNKKFCEADLIVIVNSDTKKETFKTGFKYNFIETMDDGYRYSITFPVNWKKTESITTGEPPLTKNVKITKDPNASFSPSLQGTWWTSAEFCKEWEKTGSANDGQGGLSIENDKLYGYEEEQTLLRIVKILPNGGIYDLLLKFGDDEAYIRDNIQLINANRLQVQSGKYKPTIYFKCNRSNRNMHNQNDLFESAKKQNINPQWLSSIRIKSKLDDMQQSYGEVGSNMFCRDPKGKYEEVVCKSSYLQLAEILYAKSEVYAYENGTKREVNHKNPSIVFKNSYKVANLKKCQSEQCIYDLFLAAFKENLPSSGWLEDKNSSAKNIPEKFKSGNILYTTKSIFSCPANCMYIAENSMVIIKEYISDKEIKAIAPVYQNAPLLISSDDVKDVTIEQAISMFPAISPDKCTRWICYINEDTKICPNLEEYKKQGSDKCLMAKKQSFIFTQKSEDEAFVKFKFYGSNSIFYMDKLATREAFFPIRTKQLDNEYCKVGQLCFSKNSTLFCKEKQDVETYFKENNKDERKKIINQLIKNYSCEIIERGALFLVKSKKNGSIINDGDDEAAIEVMHSERGNGWATGDDFGYIAEIAPIKFINDTFEFPYLNYKGGLYDVFSLNGMASEHAVSLIQFSKFEVESRCKENADKPTCFSNEVIKSRMIISALCDKDSFTYMLPNVVDGKTRPQIIGEFQTRKLAGIKGWYDIKSDKFASNEEQKEISSSYDFLCPFSRSENQALRYFYKNKNAKIDSSYIGTWAKSENLCLNNEQRKNDDDYLEISSKMIKTTSKILDLLDINVSGGMSMLSQYGDNFKGEFLFILKINNNSLEIKINNTELKNQYIRCN